MLGTKDKPTKKNIKTAFPFQDEAEAMEQRLSAILQAHDAELQSVYAAIVDKKDDYCEQ